MRLSSLDKREFDVLFSCEMSNLCLQGTTAMIFLILYQCVIFVWAFQVKGRAATLKRSRALAYSYEVREL